MIETTGAIDVYFEDGIEILVGEGEAFPISEVEKILEEREIKFSKIEKSATN